jgi:hypothetical protein
LKNWAVEANGQANYKIQVITDAGPRMTINLNGQNGSAMGKGRIATPDGKELIRSSILVF